jgi:flagellin
MGLMINTNIEAYDAHRNLVGTENALAKSMQRLSSGLRINSAADDAAGLAISQKLTSQSNGLDQAQRNAQDGVSLVQTAEGSLNQVHAMLQRVRELAVQYQNGTLAASDKTAIVCEVDQLGNEIDRIGRTAQFNGIALFSAGSQTINFQVGANDAEQISVTTQSMGTMVPGNGVAGAISLGASNALATIDTAIGNVSAQRAQFGAVQNRLQYTLDNLATYEENLTSSLSRIRDVDMASEMVNFTKSQILAQAGTSMLAQANSAPQSVLKLLQ